MAEEEEMSVTVSSDPSDHHPDAVDGDRKLSFSCPRVSRLRFAGHGWRPGRDPSSAVGAAPAPGVSDSVRHFPCGKQHSTQRGSGPQHASPGGSEPATRTPSTVHWPKHADANPKAPETGK